MKIREYAIKTGPEGMYSITHTVEGAICESGVKSGVCIIYCPHTTAGITINENADPDVQHDMLLGLREAYPERTAFRHMEGNSYAHLKASAMNPSQTVLIENGQPVLGTWQGIYFCEFDGPRSRRYLVKVLRDPDETV